MLMPSARDNMNLEEGKMLSQFLPKKAQATLEYAVLIIIMVGAVLAMRAYMRRAVQGRLRGVELDLNAESARIEALR